MSAAGLAHRILRRNRRTGGCTAVLLTAMAGLWAAIVALNLAQGEPFSVGFALMLVGAGLFLAGAWLVGRPVAAARRELRRNPLVRALRWAESQSLATVAGVAPTVHRVVWWYRETRSGPKGEQRVVYRVFLDDGSDWTLVPFAVERRRFERHLQDLFPRAARGYHSERAAAFRNDPSSVERARPE